MDLKMAHAPQSASTTLHSIESCVERGKVDIAQPFIAAGLTEPQWTPRREAEQLLGEAVTALVANWSHDHEMAAAVVEGFAALAAAPVVRAFVNNEHTAPSKFALYCSGALLECAKQAVEEAVNNRILPALNASVEGFVDDAKRQNAVQMQLEVAGALMNVGLSIARAATAAGQLTDYEYQERVRAPESEAAVTAAQDRVRELIRLCDRGNR